MEAGDNGDDGVILILDNYVHLITGIDTDIDDTDTIVCYMSVII